MVAARECAMERTAGGTCCLCHLPMELLEIIISRLSVLDYLFCRAVCKCWRSAFSLCAQTTSPKLAYNKFPWFLILSNEKPAGMSMSAVPTPCCLTTGRFGNLATGKIYTTDMPELRGTFVLLSKHGWLLLFSSESMFFFDMFSRAKITLPFLNVAGMWCPVYDISAPPTSPDCVVFIMSHEMDCYQVSLCSRKHLSWTTLEFSRIKTNIARDGHVEKVVFVKGIWYWFHRSGVFSTFDPANQSLKFLGRPQGMGLYQFATTTRIVSYVIIVGDQVCLRVHGSRCWYEIALMDPLRVVRTSIRYWYDIASMDPSRVLQTCFALEHCLRTDVVRAIRKVPYMIAMDSFNVDAWCATCGSNGVMTFWWHQFASLRDDIEAEQSPTEKRRPLRERCCVPSNDECSTIIMWVEPTRVHSFSNLSWTL